MMHRGLSNCRNTWRMTRIQIRTSKNPIIVAQYLRFLLMKIILNVPILTSTMRIRKISIGRLINVYVVESQNVVIAFQPLRPCDHLEHTLNLAYCYSRIIRLLSRAIASAQIAFSRCVSQYPPVYEKVGSDPNSSHIYTSYSIKLPNC